MTTYTGIDNNQIDPGSPGSTSLFVALRDDPIAISEGADNAPVLSTGWHPYNMVTVDDGNDGEIYDQAVDGGPITVTSPTFEDGYEYAFYIAGCETSAINLNPVTGTSFSVGTIASGAYGIFVVSFARVPLLNHGIIWLTTEYSGSLSTVASDPGEGKTASSSYGASPSKLETISFSEAAGTGGKIFMLRRRDFTLSF